VTSRVVVIVGLTVHSKSNRKMPFPDTQISPDRFTTHRVGHNVGNRARNEQSNLPRTNSAVSPRVGAPGRRRMVKVRKALGNFLMFIPSCVFVRPRQRERGNSARC